MRWLPLVLLLAAAHSGTVYAAPSTPTAGWQQEATAGVHFAFFPGNDVELAVRCKGNAVEVVYYLDITTLDTALKGLPMADVAFIIDASGDLIWVPTDMVVDGNVVQVGVAGEDADDLAHRFANAARSIVVSLFPTEPTPQSKPYNNTQFPVAGAAAAIKAAYAGCGLQF